MGTMRMSKLKMASTPCKQAVLAVLQFLGSEEEMDLDRAREVLQVLEAQERELTAGLVENLAQDTRSQQRSRMGRHKQR
jgi:hypothetical protein